MDVRRRALGSATSRTSRYATAAARRRRCLIVVTTLASSDGGEIAPPELIARGFAESDELIDELRTEADRVVRELASARGRDQLLQEHIHDAVGQIVYDRTRRRPMVLPVVIEVAGWQSVIEGNAASELSARRLIAQLRLQRRRSRSAGCSSGGGRGGRARDSRRTPGGLRRAADRVETASPAERPLSRYLLELEPSARRVVRGTRARSGELVEWRPSSIVRASACPNRVAAVYL